jgi:hypothetical protein
MLIDQKMVKKRHQDEKSGIIEVPTLNNERGFRLDATTAYHKSSKGSPLNSN